MALQVSLMGVMGRPGSQDGVGGPASSRGVSFGVDEPPNCGGTEGEPVGAAHVKPSPGTSALPPSGFSRSRRRGTSTTTALITEHVPTSVARTRDDTSRGREVRRCHCDLLNLDTFGAAPNR